MSADRLLVTLIVFGAVMFLLRRFVRTRKAGHGGGAGCDNCGH